MKNSQQLLSLFQNLYSQKIAPEKALKEFKFLPYQDLDFAKVDTHRVWRTDFPEIIFCEGKTSKQLISIGEVLWENHGGFVASRVNAKQVSALKKKFRGMEYRKEARTAWVGEIAGKEKKPGIAVVSAGTSDIPVAEEAAIMAEIMGNAVDRIFDVGIAGVHRLFQHGEILEKNKILIVVAGMEGALPGIVAGIFGKPVIAVPTSIGYGTGFQGVSALLTMLNTCALGIAVMNIDNGIGAGYLASLLNH